MRLLLLPVSVLLILACAGGGKGDDDGGGDDPPGIFEDQDVDDDGYDYDDDCNDDVASVNPGAQEVCGPGDVDENCNGLADNEDPDLVGGITGYPDRDGYGYGDASTPTTLCEGIAGYTTDASDCDDADPAVHPGATERCDDANVDEDCDGGADNADPEGGEGEFVAYEDADGDGFGTVSGSVCDLVDGWADADGDCDDGDGTINPDADETCDGDDDNCDGAIDENAVDADTWYQDRDRDDYGSDTSQRACAEPTGYTATDGDCDDDDATSHPGGSEVCDDADNDCDGTADDSASDAPTWYVDSDGDTYGTTSGTRVECDRPAGYAANDDDCNDASSAISPADTEICDAGSVDEDCDGVADDADTSVSGRTTWYVDADGDTYGNTSSTRTACDRPVGYITTGGDCNDASATISPAATEVCDTANTDEDCDSRADDSDTSTSAASKFSWYYDYDSDGYGYSLYYTQCDSPGSTYVSSGGDCSQFDGAVSPGGTEACNGRDDDCDSLVDEADPSLVADTWYADLDGDGHGDPAGATAVDCTVPVGYGEPDDCDDADANMHPDAEEGCFDGIDSDCDGIDRCTGTTTADATAHFTDSFTFASSVAFVGDVDGDGVKDLAVADMAEGSFLGGIYLYSGADTGTFTQSDAMVSNTSVGTDVYGYGASWLLVVDDVNGDGIEDLWTGAPRESWVSSSSDGAAYLLDGADLSQIAVISAAETGSSFGISAASLGDWDGDGDEDVMIGAPDAYVSGVYGGVYILDAAQTANGAAVSTVATTRFYSSDGSIQPGGSVCDLGDTDGDGVNDLGLSSEYTDSGYGIVLYTGGVVTGSVDVAGEPRLTGLAFLSCGGGDGDGDGYNDLAVATYDSSFGQHRAYLVPGPFSGSRPVRTAASAVLTGGGGYGTLGQVGMEDVDGDGRAEWIVGSPFEDEGPSREVGKWLALDGGLTGTVTSADAAVVLRGAAVSNELGENWIVGDLEGDGVAEVFVTGTNTYEAWLFSLADLP
ncbi:MAG: MopE-related protein [Myxococcota bacterium]